MQYSRLLYHTNSTDIPVCECCTAVCRCSELTRKDKLCENVRRMQHAKVRLKCACMYTILSL